MKNILLIVKWLPYPLVDGGKQAIFNGVLALKGFAKVHVVYYDNNPLFHPTEETLAEFRSRCPHVCLHPFECSLKKDSFFKRVLDYLYNKFKIDEVQAKYHLNELTHFPNEYLLFINELICKNQIDLVQVEMMYPLSIVLSLPDKIKKIFVHHELAYVRKELLFKMENLDLSQKVFLQEAKLLEIGLLNKYDAIITLSETDLIKLKASGVRVPIYNSFAIVTERSAVSDIQLGKDKILSFVGPDSHNPNVLGLNWFFQNCWNELLAIDSSFRLNIIGRWSEQSQAKIRKVNKNVQFMGFVDDLPASLAGTTMIVPITIGSGIRMKIQEAALIGVPFISTAIGVEGLPFTDGVDCFIEDNPNEFISKILKLQKPELRAVFIQKARQKVLTQFSMSALKDNRINILNAVFEMKEEKI